MILTAKFFELLPVETGSSAYGNWKRQNIVVLTKDTYPKKVVLTIWNDLLDISDLIIGSDYDFDLKIESHLYNGNYYSKLLLKENPSTVKNILRSWVSGIKPLKTNAKIVEFLPEKVGETWSKKEIIFEPLTLGDKRFCVSFVNNKIDITDFSIGDVVSLELLVESRNFSQNWITEIKAWKIELVEKGLIDNTQKFDDSNPENWPF
jgi:hypothetical protein